MFNPRTFFPGWWLWEKKQMNIWIPVLEVSPSTVKKGQGFVFQSTDIKTWLHLLLEFTMINKYTKKELPVTGNIMLWYTELWNINQNWASCLWKLYTIKFKKLGAYLFQRGGGGGGGLHFKELICMRGLFSGFYVTWNIYARLCPMYGTPGGLG